MTQGPAVQDAQKLQAAKDNLFKRYYSGQIRALVDHSQSFYGVEQVCDAIDFMLSGKALGKVVVDMRRQS